VALGPVTENDSARIEELGTRNDCEKSSAMVLKFKDSFRKD